MALSPCVMHATHRSGCPSRLRSMGVVWAYGRTSGTHETFQERGLGCSMCFTRSWGKVCMAASGYFSQADNFSVYYAMAIIWPQMVAVLFTVGGFYISPYQC